MSFRTFKYLLLITLAGIEGHEFSTVRAAHKTEVKKQVGAQRDNSEDPLPPKTKNKNKQKKQQQNKTKTKQNKKNPKKQKKKQKENQQKTKTNSNNNKQTAK